jgi:hypothetical protein
MKRMLVPVLALLALAAEAAPSWAQWGWPPPGYSSSSFVAPDGSHYRRLCQVLRERRQKKQAQGAPASEVPAAPAPVALPPMPAADQP